MCVCVCVHARAGQHTDMHTHVLRHTQHPHTSDVPNQGLGSSLGNGMGEGKEEETFPVYFPQLCSA